MFMGGLISGVFLTQPFAKERSAKHSSDPVLGRGLAHSKSGRTLIEKAINHSNKLIVSNDLKLVPSWKTNHPINNIAVYSVSSKRGAAATPAAVPKECRCIFVNVKVLSALIKKHTKGTARMGIDTDYFLAFMLLHEVGHIKAGNSAVEFKDGELAQLNLSASLAKLREEEADEYAATLIRNQATKEVVDDASLTALWISTALSNLSWNMQAYRTLDQFGSSVTGSPEVYFDQSYSHPNLAWRVLRSNHQIQNTKETEELLREFERIQQISIDAVPLYQKDE